MHARCPWARDEALAAYHDEEWGVPVRDDRHLFELLILEGAQAGLSWRTVLLRRDSYRDAFYDFDPKTVSRFDADDVARLLADPGIIRNRQKVASAIANARAFCSIADERGSFASYLWGWVEDRPVIHRFTDQSEVPATSELSRAISSDLSKRGMSFVGPTVIYSYLQSAGVVMDHLTSCPRYAELGGS